MKKTMKKSIFAALALVLLVGVAIILPLSSANAVEVFSAETELRQYNPAKSYGGYFMNSNDSTKGQTVYLMDMTGNVVNQWDSIKGTPKLLENGNLWSCGQVNDWDGNVLWSFDPATDTKRTDNLTFHHDGRRIWNKKLKAYTHLLIAWRTSTKEEIVAAGGDPGWDYAKRLAQQDVLVEIDQNKNIVWEWRFLDHTAQSKNPAWPNYVSDTKLAPGKLDVFWLTDNQQPAGTAGIVNDWIHNNSVDYNEDLDLIVFNSRMWSEFYVIDHGKTFVSTTDWAANRAAAAGLAGDFIYRFGDPVAYNQGTAPGFGHMGHQQIIGAHDIQWIRPYHWQRPHAEAVDKWPDPVGYTASGIALPGAGNFLIFDNAAVGKVWRTTNGDFASLSRILEINPYLNAAGVNTGTFINPPDAGYTGTKENYKSKQIIWSYRSKFVNSFYSFQISGAQRLPNGNTSITAGQQGHLFEVTPTGEVVWEYLWPGAGSSAKTIMTDGVMINMFRHYRYGKDFPGLAGKYLTPQGTITGRLPRTVGSDFTYPTPVTYYGFGFGAGGTTVGGGGVIGGSAGSGSAY